MIRHCQPDIASRMMEHVGGRHGTPGTWTCTWVTDHMGHPRHMDLRCGTHGSPIVQTWHWRPPLHSPVQICLQGVKAGGGGGRHQSMGGTKASQSSAYMPTGGDPGVIVWLKGETNASQPVCRRPPFHLHTQSPSHPLQPWRPPPLPPRLLPPWPPLRRPHLPQQCASPAPIGLPTSPDQHEAHTDPTLVVAAPTCPHNEHMLPPHDRHVLKVPCVHTLTLPPHLHSPAPTMSTCFPRTMDTSSKSRACTSCPLNWSRPCNRRRNRRCQGS